ncbi:MAG TPA: putative Ig domain-containing protein [Sedimentisphaerales bacterium]|nr:putative Ig domain-containing protein [Sedimentisphaerales bacterium]HRV46866.1 putative Ig domain-containing protein [Sedimentisphaerales bacterium]
MSGRMRVLLPCLRRGVPFGAQGWIILLTLIVGPFVTAGTPVGAAIYYVDAAQGNDSNPGTAQQPWKTMQQVRATSSAGDRISILAWTDALSESQWPSDRLYSAKTVYQHGITWAFSQECRIGQFANRDYWVVGPVSINGISPSCYVASDGSRRNGSMINPVTNVAQGFDSRSNYWNSSVEVSYGISASDPLHVPVHSSLISTISLSSASSASYVGAAAILTVLPEAPAPNSFRPPYFGTDKTVRHTTSEMDYSVLGSLDANSVSGKPTLVSAAGMFRRPWIDFGAGWGGRTFHPAANMQPYGRELSVQVGIGALMLQLNYTDQQKHDLLVSMVQLGIDNYGIVSHPGGRTTWEADGGHCMGRKFPILLAGKVLNDQSMLNVGQKSGAYLWSPKPGGGNYGPGNIPPDYMYFQEDMQSFYVDQYMVDLQLATSVSGYVLGATSNTITISGLPKWYGQPHHQRVEITSGPGVGQIRYATTSNYDRTVGDTATLTLSEAWNVIPTTSSQYRMLGYETRHLGMAEWGVRHATIPTQSNPCWGADYRWINGVSWPGWTLAARIMGLEDEWNHDAMFDYVDRWMENSLPGGMYERTEGATYDTFTTNMWVTYRHALAPASPKPDDDTSNGTMSPPQIQTIAGRSVSSQASLSFQVAENQTISLVVSATDADGDSITYSAAGLPSGASFSGQTFTWTPTYAQGGSYQVTFIASDGRSQDSETITITVTNVNRAPTLSPIGDRSVDENQALTFSVSASDPDGDSITYSATGLPSGANFANGSFRWTPASSQVGSHAVTFVASDGSSQDSETVTIFVVGTSADGTAPVVARRSPEPDAIQVSLNNLVTLHVTDAGRGVDPESVTIRVDGHIVYQGDASVYESPYGRCSRSGASNDYRFIYQATQAFGFDHTVTVEVSAADRAGNAMNAHSYSFTTEMRAFGSNRPVTSNCGITGSKSSPATIADPAGNIWAVWCNGAEGSRDVYVSRMAADSQTFAAPVSLTTAASDQCNPDIARDSAGVLYVVWQDKQRGNWDIFLSTSSDGVTWSRPIAVTDSDHNETHPAVAADSGSPSRVYIVWQDDRDGQADIFAISSTNAFADALSSRLTTHAADQITPDVAIGADDIAYVVWTDMRNGQADLYGSSSSIPGWTNTPIVRTNSEQTHPAIACDRASGTLHLLWVDNAPGNADIYYAALEALPDVPISGTSIIDDTSGAGQFAPAIVCTDDSRVFGCWQDRRHARQRASDTDLFIAELGPGSAGTNIFVGDDGTNSGQSEPAIGIDGYGNPYVVWTDARGSRTEIYSAATTFVDPNPLDARHVVASVGATIGVDPASIDEPDDVSIVVPARACQSDVRISISRILNPPVAPAECLGSYDFGPSGIDFDIPVTVTIPYRFSGSGNAAKPYWYDSLTGALSQSGITDIQNIVIAPNLNALRFKTTHFTPFYLVAGDPDSGDGDSDSSGGCSVSAGSHGSPKELVVPYAIVALAMAILKRRDRRKQHSLEATEG